MRVLHILDHSQPIVSGYSSRSHYILKWQRKLGMFPIALTSPLYNCNNVFYDEIEGIKYYRTHLSRKSLQYPFCRELSTILKLTRRIKEISHAEQPDVIHAHSPSTCGFAAALAAKALNKPFVYEVRAFWEDAAVDQVKFGYNSIKYKIYQKFENLVFKKADAIITICKGLKNEIINRGFNPNKIFVIPNGVDLSKFNYTLYDSTLAKRLGVNNHIVLGFIGSFYKFEGLELLVKAVAKLSDKKVKLILVGNGEKFKEITKLVTELNLTSKVILVGRVPHEEVRKYYSLMDIMVYPRLSERITELVTPLKPLEAMALRKIVIGSDVGGIKEIIGEGKNAGGILFRAGDINSLINKLKLVINDLNLQTILRKKAYQRAQQRDWSKIAKGYLQVYDFLQHKQT